MSEIKNDYIEKATSELIYFFGVRESINYQNLISLIKSKKIKECIKVIAFYLGLPIDVNISYVPRGYRPSSGNGFQSTHLVKTDQNKRGANAITAQVSIPLNLPFYGTERMVNFSINIRLSEDCAENPTTFISIMAHELAHVLLYSLLHSEKENEFYTDLTAMILGFADVMEIGRKVVKINSSAVSGGTVTRTETTIYGYLSDENFYFAFSKIKNELSKQKSTKKKLLKKLKHFNWQLNKGKKLVFYFNNYLEYLGENINQRISQKDAGKISAFYQAGYTDYFQTILMKNEKESSFFLKSIEDFKSYRAGMEVIKQCEIKLSADSKKFSSECSLISKDVDILKKYVGFFYKLRLLFRKS